jgi:hypothetical protein
MGSLKIQRLSDAEICQQYRDGQSQGYLSLKARISTAAVRTILVAHGVRVRQSAEALRLSLRARPRKPPSRPVFKGNEQPQ